MKYSSKKNHILVVDDHPAIRETMKDILCEEGFKSQVAENGKDALNLCLANDFDFVLIDIQMPELNGVDVLRKLKELKKKIPKFIFFSAYSTTELEELALSLGAYAFLTKPIKVEKILDLLRQKKAISILVHLNDDHLRKCITNLLTETGYSVNQTKEHDDALIQLRQINYNLIIFDSDSPSLEQESIEITIRSANTKTICLETNEDESPKEVIEKVDFVMSAKPRDLE